MKINKLISISLLAAVAAGCDVKPAEEQIAETGSTNFSATFETVKNAKALWSLSDRLIVVDSDGNTSKFTLDSGAAQESAEFSGEITPKTTVKYVLYSGDNNVDYDAVSNEFKLSIPSTYAPKEDSGLLTYNDASIGTLSGSEVQMKAIGGFVRIIIAPTGEEVEVGGMSYPLTDLKKLTIEDKDGKFLAGKITAVWPEDAVTPSVKTALAPDGSEMPVVEDGESLITFVPKSVTLSTGEIYYVAGEYYLPVITQEYKNLAIAIEDVNGNKSTIKTGLALNVQRAVSANGAGTIEWPTITLKANFVTDSDTFSASGINVSGFGSNNLGCDRWNISTGEKTEGKTKKRTEIAFTNKVKDSAAGVVTEYKYSAWTTMGMGESTSSSKCQAFLFNTYNANWNYQNIDYRVGTQTEWGWIKIPGQEGVLSKLVISVSSGNSGPVTICDEVDDDGHPAGNILAQFNTTTAIKEYNIPILGAVEDKEYYIVLGEGHTYKIQNWTIYYKVYQKDE